MATKKKGSKKKVSAKKKPVAVKKATAKKNKPDTMLFGGLLGSDLIGKPIDETSIDTHDASIPSDARLRLVELSAQGADAQIRFDPLSRRVYSFDVFTQQQDAAGVMSQQRRAEELVARFTREFGNGKQKKKKKDITWSWEVEGVSVALSFSEKSNFAGWYADLGLTMESSTPVDKFLLEGQDKQEKEGMLDTFLRTFDRSSLEGAQRELEAMDRQEAMELVFCELIGRRIESVEVIKGLVAPLEAKLHPDTIRDLVQYSGLQDDEKTLLTKRLVRWAEFGEEQEYHALLEVLQGVDQRRINFWYGSGALPNARLMKLRLALLFDDDLEAALAAAVESRHHGELPLLSALMADRVGEPALAFGHKTDIISAVGTLASFAPEQLALHLSKLIQKGSYRAWFKWEILGVIPWEQISSGEEEGSVVIVATFNRVTATLRGSADGKKLSLSCVVARTLEAVEKTRLKAIAAAEKKTGITLNPGAVDVQGFNLPADELDLHHRAASIRALSSLKPAKVGISKFFDPVALFDLMSHGVRVTGVPEKGTLDKLEAGLLPGHFEKLCRRSWGDDYMAELEKARA